MDVLIGEYLTQELYHQGARKQYGKVKAEKGYPKAFSNLIIPRARRPAGRVAKCQEPRATAPVLHDLLSYTLSRGAGPPVNS
jgi:hypothetical protein